MRAVLERFLLSFTPSHRLLLAIFASAPVFLIVAVALQWGLTSEEVRPHLQVPVARGLQLAYCLAALIEVVVAVRIWPQRDQPHALPRLTTLVCLVIGMTFTTQTVVSGPITDASPLVLIGVLAVGLLLFERGPVLLSYLLTIAYLSIYDFGVVMQWWRYAPIWGDGLFLGREPVWWLSTWRQFVFLAGSIVLIGLLLALFEHLDALHAQLKRLSYTDALTGLANRRQFMEVLETEAARQHRVGRPLCLVMMDVDHFKRVNDEHGHDVGDQVLRGIAEVLMACVRSPTDLPCRMGGEEFALVLPDTDLVQAQAACERLREALAARQFGPAEQPFRVTVSMGVVACRGAHTEPCLRAADQLLYRAKAAGRDRICAAHVGGTPAEMAGAA